MFPRTHRLLKPYSYGNGYFRPSSVFKGKNRKRGCGKKCQVLEQFGLSDYAFRQMGQLSGGERQRILIARALAGDPQVLLLDEPTSSLDLRYQYEVMEFLVKVSREKNLAVVAVIHDLNLALDFDGPGGIITRWPRTGRRSNKRSDHTGPDRKSLWDTGCDP